MPTAKDFFKLKVAYSQKGFTLIELLIVIAIIGILATIATVSLGSSQRRARDAQRKSDLKQVQNALEVYYNSNNAYPGIAGTAISGAPWGGSWASYMRVVPKDPLSTGTYCYTQTTNQDYSLYANLENTGDPERLGPYTQGSCAAYTYRLQNPF